MDKLRLRFKKTGRAVYISHLDLMQTMQRAFSRAGYELKYSEGFNPHPQISIALPLSVGAASFCEIMDFKLKGEADISDIPARLTAALPEGLEVTDCYEPQRKAAELKYLRVKGIFEYDERDVERMAQSLRDFYSAGEIVISKKTKRGSKDIDLKEYLPKLAYSTQGDTLRFEVQLPCAAGEGVNLNPALLLEHLQKTHELPPWQCEVLRTQLYTKSGEKF